MNIITLDLGRFVITDYGRPADRRYYLHDRTAETGIYISPDEYAFIAQGENHDDRCVSAAEIWEESQIEAER